MKQVRKFVLIIFIFFAYGQNVFGQNEFTIGMFGANFLSFPNSNCKNYYPNLKTNSGFNTSTLNVIKADGFNVFQTYAPNEWTSESELRDILNLSKKNGIQVELGAIHYYHPAIDSQGKYLGFGKNNFDNCGIVLDLCKRPFDDNYFRQNIEHLLHTLYSSPLYKDIIWGYHISEESSYFQYKHFNENCLGNWWQNTDYFIPVEVPPVNVLQAIHYFKENLVQRGIQNHRTVVMEANHHKNINSNTADHEGIFNPQDYIKILNPKDSREVFFEGSYTQFPDKEWTSQDYAKMFRNGHHYLGPFKSLDFALNHTPNVHKVINIEGSYKSTNYLKHYHSNPAVPNANWLWFQAFNSIIHGAKGIWFWDLNHMWSDCEKPEILINNMGISNDAILTLAKSFCDNELSQIKDENFNCNNETFVNCKGESTTVKKIYLRAIDVLFNQQESRFETSNFPNNYLNYVSELAKQLRYLVNNRIVSDNPETILFSKTDQADPNCLLFPAENYIPSYLPTEKRTENYSLRYTIRSNGTDYYMIITNPLNTVIKTRLNVANAPVEKIRGALKVDVLFENQEFSAYQQTYKLDRSNSVDLSTNQVLKSYSLYLDKHHLELTFGPMDVKILKFATDSNSIKLPQEKTNINHCLPQLKIFPNPTFGSVNISSDVEIAAVRIYDSKGQELFHFENLSGYQNAINIPEVEPQMLIIKTTTISGLTYINKLIYLQPK